MRPGLNSRDPRLLAALLAAAALEELLFRGGLHEALLRSRLGRRSVRAIQVHSSIRWVTAISPAYPCVVVCVFGR